MIGGRDDQRFVSDLAFEILEDTLARRSPLRMMYAQHLLVEKRLNLGQAVKNRRVVKTDHNPLNMKRSTQTADNAHEHRHPRHDASAGPQRRRTRARIAGGAQRAYRTGPCEPGRERDAAERRDVSRTERPGSDLLLRALATESGMGGSTASGGGSCPSFRNRRTFEYDAVSTSIENFESGLSVTRRNGLSTMRA